jgi:membrane protease subunit HflC
MRRKIIALSGAIFLVAAAIAARQAFFTVNETEQVVITQFGEYIRTIPQPGLHLKFPFIQKINRFEKRILVSDAPDAEYLTQDKKRLVADPLTRWRVAEPLLFYKTVRDESGARARLDDLVFSELRREVAATSFDVVIGENREAIMDAVAARAREKARKFGIEIIDVRITRADLPREVQASVFARMQAEREREAKRYRSEGEEEAAKLRAETDKERTIILATAEQQAEQLRGQGDAKATQIYAAAYGKDPEFYRFIRSLQSYEQFLAQRSTLLLSADAPLFQYLRSPEPDQRAPVTGNSPSVAGTIQRE